jgi:hypothetical protein
MILKRKYHEDAIAVKLTAEGQEKTVTLLGSKGKIGESKTVKIGNIDYTFLRSKAYVLPQNQIKRFHCRKIPGTEKVIPRLRQSNVQDKEPFDANLYE